MSDNRCNQCEALMINGVYCHETGCPNARKLMEPTPESIAFEEMFEPDEPDDGMSDVEADADTLRSIGWGTDEDYGYYGDGDDW